MNPMTVKRFLDSWSPALEAYYLLTFPISVQSAFLMLGGFMTEWESLGATDPQRSDHGGKHNRVR